MREARSVPEKNFFISYNRADRAWAEWIAWQLEEAGYSTVLQAWDFRPGANFVLEMDRATKMAQRTIAVLSPEYVDALYTQPEWAAAFSQDPTGERGSLVPVRVRPVELQGLLRPIVYIDLVGHDEVSARESLLRGVSGARGRPSTAPPFPNAPVPVHTVPKPRQYPGEVSAAHDAADEQEMLARARELMPQRLRIPTPALCVAIAGGPLQTVIRPAQLDDPQTVDQLTRVALLGPAPVFTTREGTNSSLEGEALVLSQDNASVLIDGRGSIRIIQAARSENRRWLPVGVPSIIHEDIQDRIEQALRFAAGFLDQVDPARRISDVVPVAAVLEASSLPWRTRAEQAASPNSARMPLFGRENVVMVELAPASRNRAALGEDAAEIAEDLVALLRRRMSRT